MKNKSIYLAIIFVFQLNYSFSQANAYFKNNPEWHIISDWYSGVDCYGERDDRNYYLNGDTILNGLAYKKVYKKGIIWGRNHNCQLVNPAPYSNKQPSFCIRSADKKMFIVNPGKGEELLYDFNLSVGDTLPKTYTYNPATANYAMYVTKIDSIYTPNGYMKRFALGNQRDTLYEGIGSTGGLEDPIFRLFLSGRHELICYGQNRISYASPKGFDCNLALGVPSPETEGALAFPNPFSDKTGLQFKTELKNACLKMYNINGAVVKTVFFSGTSLTVERQELKQGIYYYQVEADNKSTFTGKLMIIDP